MTLEQLEIESTQSTPSIHADAKSGVLTMRGDSYPENSFDFFADVFNWTEQYLAECDAELQLQLHVVYMNTSSVKAMMDLFDMMEAAFDNGAKVSVKWFYDQRNERVVEMVEEFKEDCTFPFDIVPE